MLVCELELSEVQVMENTPLLKDWKGLVEKLITHRYPVEDFARAFEEHPENEIKAVIEWAHR